ncbi:hypothetical protein EDC02_5940 [Micromonospora sp. Llam0]|uniref:hypothetical protein n=1 Tax=Micromonospora sp. Llam0 TaxID=2485143 RepID=UPI000F4A5472|nr:hypothetical protein [Micromonospora sp. Llam0]ROO51076.1 hypothetical protein EDC02_5940 [Micromonospora sp. Llam0]
MELEWNGDKIAAVLRDATLDGLELAAEHLLQVSSTLVPHEEGDLERSGEVSTDPDQEAAAVSYDRLYAVYQHESMNLRHDNGRQAKFLEQPQNDPTERQTMLALIAKASGKPLQ